jgi:hypothetical protein
MIADQIFFNWRVVIENSHCRNIRSKFDYLLLGKLTFQSSFLHKVSEKTNEYSPYQMCDIVPSHCKNSNILAIMINE